MILAATNFSVDTENVLPPTCTPFVQFQGNSAYQYVSTRSRKSRILYTVETYVRKSTAKKRKNVHHHGGETAGNSDGET